MHRSVASKPLVLVHNIFHGIDGRPCLEAWPEPAPVASAPLLMARSSAYTFILHMRLLCANKKCNSVNRHTKGGGTLTEDPQFTKLDQAIIYLVHKLYGLTRTKLVKLLYLADIAHYTRTNTSLTKVTYYSYYYGPYSEGIIESIEKLNPYEIEESYRTSKDGREYYTYSLGRYPRITNLNLTHEESQTLDEIITTYGAMNLDDLLKYVYGTPQYRKSRKGETITITLND